MHRRLTRETLERCLVYRSCSSTSRLGPHSFPHLSPPSSHAWSTLPISSNQQEQSLHTPRGFGLTHWVPTTDILFSRMSEYPRQNGYTSSVSLRRVQLKPPIVREAHIRHTKNRPARFSPNWLAFFWHPNTKVYQLPRVLMSRELVLLKWVSSPWSIVQGKLSLMEFVTRALRIGLPDVAKLAASSQVSSNLGFVLVVVVRLSSGYRQRGHRSIIHSILLLSTEINARRVCFAINDVFLCQPDRPLLSHRQPQKLFCIRVLSHQALSSIELASLLCPLVLWCPLPKVHRDAHTQ